MNKNVKKIVAIALAIGTISAVAPATNVNLLSTKAYATDNENTDEELDSLKLETSDGSNIKLYSDDDYNSSDKVDSDDVEDNGKYFAKTSSSTIRIDTDGPSTKYIKVFKGTSNSTKGKSITSDISLSSGTNTLTVKVYNNKPDSDVRYDDGDVASEYTIKIKCTGDDSSSSSSSSDSSDNYDDIYLDKLTVEGESISLSKSKTTYTCNVASDVDEATIKAVPEDTDYTVTIDGNEVNEDDDKYKDDVSLSKGENEIKVKIEDEDNNDERVYTLKITRGTTSSTSTSTGNSTTTTPAVTVKVGWVQVNGLWQYNDSLGNPLKNQWFFDRNLGKWYYLYSDGNMAYNTTIDGYKVGADGAWIK